MGKIVLRKTVSAVGLLAVTAVTAPLMVVGAMLMVSGTLHAGWNVFWLANLVFGSILLFGGWSMLRTAYEWSKDKYEEEV